jgi:hypothetical protein
VETSSVSRIAGCASPTRTSRCRRAGKAETVPDDACARLVHENASP